MFKTLFKKQMLELNRSLFQNKKTGQAKSAPAVISSIIFFAALMIFVIGGIFYYVANMLSPLIEVGSSWLYFMIIGLMSVVLGIFGSVFNTYASLYNAKDNDLLLSLPIPVRNIIVIRLIGVYLMGLLYSGIVMVPALIVYYSKIKPTASAIVCPLIFTLLISLFVLVLSCILGWVVAKISNKLKNKSFIVVILSLVFIAAYYYLYFKANEMLMSIIKNIADVSATVKGKAFILYAIGNAASGNVIYTLIISAVILLMLIATYAVLAHGFIKIATGNSSSQKAAYKEKAVKVKSTDRALFGRELGKYLSSPVYMLNCSLGTLILLAFGILSIIRQKQLQEMLMIVDGFADGITAFVAAVATCFLISMNDITAPSVSLEGKNIWLIQSLPVSTKKVLKAKLNLHLALTAVPAVICSICFSVAIGINPWIAALLAVLAVAYTLLCATAGLTINLKMPNLKWTNEAAVVKQSFGILLTMLLEWVYIIAMGAIYLGVRNYISGEIYILIWTLLTAAISAVLLRFINTDGVKIFERL